MNLLKQARSFKRRYLNQNTGVHLYGRLEKLFRENKDIDRLFPYDDFSGHYVYEPARQTIDHPDIYINQVRYFRMYQYFQEHYPDMFREKVSIVDVGDTSGLLFKAMNKPGLSVNINTEVVDYIQRAGIQAELGDIEQLQYPDKSFDYSFCFECIEHLPNPIKALQELSRITKKNVFISIPYVQKTQIYDRTYWQRLKMNSVDQDGWNEEVFKEVDGHKFEFSTGDFRKVMSHASLKYINSYPINYFEPLGQSAVNKGSYFNFFVLAPEK